MVLHLCLNEGFCVDYCEHRANCKKQRIPFLIKAVVVDYSEDEVYCDEYLNEIAKLKRDLISRSGGKEINVDMKYIFKINTL